MIAKRRTGANRPTALQNFAVAGTTPLRAVEPADARETAATLRACADAGEAVIAFGGGTLQRSSNRPARYDVALSTRRLDAVHAYDPRELTIGVGAGTTLRALRATLAEHGQMLPLDAPLPDAATVGGTLAAGWIGPRRAAYGRARDLLIGSTIALADGTLASAGGMVVKNVTGYDMSRLYVGSYGTLGVLARANFKLLPAPAARQLAISPFDAEQRERLIAHAQALDLSPVALLLLDGIAALREPAAAYERDPRPRIAALFEGSAATVERGVRDYRSALGGAGIAETRIHDGAQAETGFQAMLDEYLATPPEHAFTLLAHGLPSDAAPRAARARAAGDALREQPASPRVDTITDLLTGDVVVRVRGSMTSAAGAEANDAGPAADDGDATVAALRALRDALGGRARIVVARDDVLASGDAWGAPPPTLAVMRALKERFDPGGVLAPGRFVGGI